MTTEAPNGALLRAIELRKEFGGVVAVNNVNLHITSGEILALIGPNGAGKTTTFNLISGTHKLDSGQVIFRGETISGQAPHSIAAAGVVRTFQNLQIFSNMSVLGNVMVGCHNRGSTGFVRAAVRWPGTAQEEHELREFALSKLEQVGLQDRAHDAADSLPFGQQRLVEIARALASEPVLLLLDEPAAGLTQAETDDLNDLVLRLCADGITILLVEHDMNLVMGIANRVAVLQYGMKIADGTPATIQADEQVISAYLGDDWQSEMSH